MLNAPSLTRRPKFAAPTKVNSFSFIIFLVINVADLAVILWFYFNSLSSYVSRAWNLCKILVVVFVASGMILKYVFFVFLSLLLLLYLLLADTNLYPFTYMYFLLRVQLGLCLCISLSFESISSFTSLEEVVTQFGKLLGSLRKSYTYFLGSDQGYIYWYTVYIQQTYTRIKMGTKAQVLTVVEIGVWAYIKNLSKTQKQKLQAQVLAQVYNN